MDAALLAKCSLLAYGGNLEIVDRRLYSENGRVLRELGFNTVNRYDVDETQGFLAVNHQERFAVLAFRGTDSVADWLTDCKCRKRVAGPFGRVHRGFLEALHRVWPKISRDASGFFHRQLYVTGHSLGAALATIAAVQLAERGVPVAGLCTFGSPRVGDATFAQAVEARVKEIRRFVHCCDAVTRVPGARWGYQHVGDFEYFDSDGKLHHEPGGLYVGCDRIKRRWERGRLGDGLDDHSMTEYARLVDGATYPRVAREAA